jgi:hypothetical protein
MKRRLAKWLIPAWALQFFLVGTTPIGGWFHPGLDDGSISDEHAGQGCDLRLRRAPQTGGSVR